MRGLEGPSLVASQEKGNGISSFSFPTGGHCSRFPTNNLEAANSCSEKP